ncbi:MAG TPA: aminodeoxychorismate/anthranilate synthase component II [Opitutae bacterium]|nr:aminodeoxychorismate/anthranilate synthase component II [Opitutae bacterium]|tara:strand:- start:944 stop:1531 length:588 start_codon:yes stop_codon:yes gene_type:complete
MILLVDNYDSFTYNLYQYFLILGEETAVIRNDDLDLDKIEAMHPSLIVISPGPGRPESAGLSMDLVTKYRSRIPILGICLGMQIVAQCYGGRIVRADEPVHGKVRQILHTGTRLFKDISSPMNVTRYHSLLVERSSLPLEFLVDAESQEGEIMAISHRTNPIWGVQFHPEAILTDSGLQLLSNAVVQASRCETFQ